MIALAIMCLLSVAAVGLRALPRPAAELIVDALYWLAQRAYAAAVSGDRALVAYRSTRRQAERETVREYQSLATHSAEFQALAAGAAENETTGAAGASGCPSMEVA